MASRFTDTEIWNEDWFCEMPGEYQLFVKYVFDRCNNAGVWKPNKFDFETKAKFKVSLDLLFKRINGGGQHRVLLLENGRWFLTGYILFQWFNKKKTFDLALSNRLHKSLYDILVENKVPLVKVRGLREVLKTSMEVVMEKTALDVGEGTGEEEGQPINGFFSDTLDPKTSLTEMDVGRTVEFIRIKSGVTLSSEDILQQWEAFKIQVIGQKEWYKGFGALINHFRHSLKKEKNGTAAHIQLNGSKSKAGTSQERIDTAKKW